MTEFCSFKLLAPNGYSHSERFPSAKIRDDHYVTLLHSLQALRGQTYFADGAINGTDLDSFGRFEMSGDEHAWHLLLVDDAGLTVGCVRYLLHEVGTHFSQLQIAHSAIACDPVWAPKVREAVEQELERASMHGLPYVEVGGWALAEKWRNTRAAFELLIGSFALGALWGGCLGCCTATVRHSSSSMLRRLGGESFTADGDAIPAYEDPRYGCRMELLRFDYRKPAKRFAPLINPFIKTLSETKLIVPPARTETQDSSEGSIDLINLEKALAARVSHEIESYNVNGPLGTRQKISSVAIQFA